MVALSSSSSSASSDSDPASDLPSLEAILDVPQRHFPRFLFDSDPLAVLELLSSMLYRSSERGHPAVIECLCCWQDLTDSSHSLSPLLDELRSAQDARLVVAGLRLLVRLLQFAPDRVSLARLRNEMDELRLDEFVPSLISDRFSASRNHQELEDCLADWMRLRAEKPELLLPGCRSADADSGTFSADEEVGNPPTAATFSTSSIPPGAERKKNGTDEMALMEDLTRHVAAFPDSVRSQLLELFREMADLRAEDLSLALRSIRISIANYGHTQPATSSSAQSSHQQQMPPPIPPPPPPPMAPPPPPGNGPRGGRALPANRQQQGGGGNNDDNDSLATTAAAKSRPAATADIPRPLRPKALPGLGRRLRHLQWAKLPTMAVANPSAATNNGQSNIWLRMDTVDRELRDRLDFASLDALFGCPSTPVGPDAAPQPGRRSSLMPNPQGQHSDCVTLLGPRRSLSVNVFLKMCRDTGQLLADLAAGRAQQIGADRLRTLAQLLPSEEEQKALGEFDGDRARLGQAEQFLLALSTQIPEYRIRLEAMLFRLDLEAVEESGTGLEPWLSGAQELMSSPALQRVLYILLHVGNYLNHGAGAGNAIGFRLSSLWKVEDVKAVGGRGRNLLHFVAQQAENCAEELASQLASVHEASSKSSVEAVKDDLKGLLERMRRLQAQIGAITGRDAFFAEFGFFLKKSEPLAKTAEQQLAKLDSLRQQLAAFFCESERTFSLEDCFKVVNGFLNRFEKAVEENRQRDGAKRNSTAQMKMAPKESENAKKSAEVRTLTTANQQKPKDEVPVAMARKEQRKTFGLVEQRERESEHQQQRKTITNNNGTLHSRRRTFGVTPALLEGNFLPNSSSGETNGQKQVRTQANLETIVDLALTHQQNRAANGQQKGKVQAQPALIGISEAAKGRLSGNNSPIAKRAPLGGVANRIDQFEVNVVEAAQASRKGAAGQPNPATTPSSRKESSRGALQRLNSIRNVRAVQMNALVMHNNTKNEAIQQQPQLSPLRRPAGGIIGNNAGNGGICCKQSGGAAKVEANEEVTSKMAERPSTLHRAKSCVQSPKMSPLGGGGSPLQRVASQNGVARNQQSQQTTPKGSRSKPVLTRQVSTASRPTLINTGSSDKKPKWV